MQYETPDQHQHKHIPDEAAAKLGSAQPDNDRFAAVGSAPAGIPTEYIAADALPVAVLPVEGIPMETQAVDFMTPEARPVEARPREVFPTELR